MDNERLSLPQYDIPEDLQHGIAATTPDRQCDDGWQSRASAFLNHIQTKPEAISSAS